MTNRGIDDSCYVKEMVLSIDYVRVARVYIETPTAPVVMNTVIYGP